MGVGIVLGRGGEGGGEGAVGEEVWMCRGVGWRPDGVRGRWRGIYGV